jgi:putative N6-adenine-specific DNA methylase
MAAAMVLLSGWVPETGLVDPFCGVGTIGIEAALLAGGAPPGGERDYAFHRWPDFEPGSWASVVGSIGARAGAASSAGSPGPILLSDRDGEMVAAARRNAERAGVADLVQIETRVVGHLRGRPGPGTVITNPPYGKRVGRGDLTGLYRRLGAVVRERLPGHALALLTPDPKLARAADGGLRSTARFRHGGLAVELFRRPPLETPTDNRSQGEPVRSEPTVPGTPDGEPEKVDRK